MSKLLERLKLIWANLKTKFSDSRYNVAKIGALLLIAALVLTWLGLTWWALGVLIATGFVDLYLVLKKKDTISNWIHDLFPRAIDAIIMVGLLIFTWFVFGPTGFVPVLIGVIIGHILWH